MSRFIPWESLDVSALSIEARSVIGETWRARTHQEHLAVGAFALLAQELAADGCEPAVLDLVTRAANDEVRHADVCRRMTVAVLGEDALPARDRGVPKVPQHADGDGRARVLLHVVEMCCLGETLTSVYFTDMLSRTTNPTARAAVESLLEDEIDHGRVGWAYLATRVREGDAAGLAPALPAMFERTLGRTLTDLANAREDDASWNAFGWLGRTHGTNAARHALRRVIIPGFELLGIDLAPSEDTIAALGGRA